MRGTLFVLLIAGVLVSTALLCALPQEFRPSQQRQYGATPPGTLGIVLDSDQDGVMDVDEVFMGLNPQNPDSDGDGMRDRDEVNYWNNLSLQHRGQPAPSWLRARHAGATDLFLAQQWGPTGDLDGDGRPNANDSDADSDGVMDGREVSLGLRPGDPDTDVDGVVDGLDPNPGRNSDTDLDGLADDWETYHGVSDPVADTDLDGSTNLQEFQSGSDPNSQFRPGNRQFGFTESELRLQGFGDFYGGGSLTEAVAQITPITNPRYWRLQTYSAFDGRKWTGAADFRPYNGTLPDPSEVLPLEMRNNGETYRIVINGTVTGFLPTAAHTTAISYVDPRGQRVEANSQATFRTQGAISAYNLTADIEIYDAGMNAAVPDSSFSGFLSTPYSSSSKVRTLALNITAGRASAMDKLEAIALYLRANYRFNRYAAAPAPSEDPVDHFLLDSKAGIAPDFASAYTMICRLNGIPARLAVGFAPGIIRGDARYVQLGHKHAWAEVNLKGYGWVGVECTPENAAPGNGIGLGSSGIDLNILQFWANGVNSWWYDEDLQPNVGGTGGGSVSGGFMVVISPNATAGDSDGDGLNDTEEAAVGTNPYSRDTDQDGLDDAFERAHRSNPRMNDADGDGLSDSDEVNIYHTNPNKADTDGGGTCDHQEVDGHTDPLDPSDDRHWRDFDNDRIADWDEARRNLDARGSDLDRDGLTDMDEVSRGTDPARADTDGDGLFDTYETELGTDPSVGDSDGDGLNDGLEMGQGLNPLSTDTDSDGLDDASEYYNHDLDPRVFDQDGDGLSDSQELQQTMDPRDPDSNGNGVRDGQDVLDPGGGGDAPARVDGTPAALAGLVVVLALAAIYALWRRQHVEEIESSLRRAERQILELDVDSEPDEVRRVIYRTYKDLCNSLRKYGFLRGKAVTMREFEKAVESAIRLDAARLAELTGIVEEARYSDHRLSADYKDRALSCIRGVLGSMSENSAPRPLPKGKAAA